MDDDPRHLWPHITNGIRELGYPPIVFFENVEGIISSKLKGDGWADPAGTPVLLHVLRELERMGYEATAGVFSASEVGAPHQRKRVFIMGCRADLSSEGRGIVDRLLRGTERGRDVEHPHSKRAERADVARLCSLPTQTSQGGAERGQDVGYTESDPCGHDSEDGRKADRKEHFFDNTGSSQRAGELAYPAPRGAEQYPWEPPRVTGGNAVHRDEGSRRRTGALPTESGDRETSEPTRTDHTPSERVQGQIEPTMGGDSDGLAGGMVYAELCHAVDNRTDELRLLGNGVVPATAERAFRVLWADLRD